MKLDDFEQKLRRQELRQIPDAWRSEILSAAEKASPVRAERQPHWLVSLFWPHPKAWAALAAVWILILVMNHYAMDDASSTVAKVAPPSRELIVVLREQRRELARLIEPAPVADVDKPNPIQMRPRSELRAATIFAA